MSALKAYLHFIHHFNPSHIFTEKEREFIYRDFKDLKTFVEGLCGKESIKYLSILPGF
jgi:benzoyl-CoA reductase/2-hydroxyglutaryl-CoA dehydratase subunit BcrC/BadD/HgdB